MYQNCGSNKKIMMLNFCEKDSEHVRAQYSCSYQLSVDYLLVLYSVPRNSKPKYYILCWALMIRDCTCNNLVRTVRVGLIERYEKRYERERMRQKIPVVTIGVSLATLPKDLYSALLCYLM